MNMNKYFNYAYKYLWFSESWSGCGSQTNPLAQWIQEKNYRGRSARPVFFPFGTPGKLDSKSHSIPIPELIEYWHNKGLDYYVREMGGVRWVTMLPHFCQGSNRLKVLLTLCDADYANPYWSMEILDRYADYCEQAATEKVALLFVASDGVDADNTYVRILQESAAIYHIKLNEVYLDISTVQAAGADLKEISGISSENIKERLLLGIPVIDITNLWQNRVGQIYATVMSPKAKSTGFVPERLINSSLGKRMAESMVLQSNFSGGTDPSLTDFWLRKGVSYDRHYCNDNPWVAMLPLSAKEDQNPIPLIIAMQEVTDDNPHATLIAMSYHYGLLEKVSSGDAMVIMFALECPDDNEILCEIIAAAKEIYPIDARRIYLTGHSHNGMYSLAFAQRHPQLLAGIATLGNTHGIEIASDKTDNFKLSESKLKTFLEYDMPLININGEFENSFSVGRLPEDKRRELFCTWQNRLKYFNCPAPSYDAFVSLPDSHSKAAQKIGLAGGRISTRYLSSYECYTLDIANNEGNNHLRFVTVEDMIHLNAPIMADLSWEFLRRFSRDPQTGMIIEE